MKILSLAYYTVVENIRQKIFYVLILFGIILLGAAGLLGAIGGEQKITVLKDLGFFATEIISLVSALFISTGFLYDEMDTKSIYLIFSRPVKKRVYLLGRYLGILTSLTIMILLMGALNFGVLYLAGSRPEFLDLSKIVLIVYKIAIVSAIAIFFTIATTSKLTALGFSLFFWVLGYFTAELNFLSRLAASFVLKSTSFILYIIVPHLYKFSQQATFNVGRFFLITLYTVVYISVCITATMLFFRKKEF